MPQFISEQFTEQDFEDALYDSQHELWRENFISAAHTKQPSIASKIVIAMGSLYDVEVTENTVLKIVALHNIFK